MKLYKTQKTNHANHDSFEFKFRNIILYLVLIIHKCQIVIFKLFKSKVCNSIN